MGFVVSKGARRNLDDTFLYSAERASMEVADRIIDAIFERFKLLGKYPDLGRRSDDLRQGTYRFSAGRYLIYYQKRGRSIDIIRVIHGARDQAPLL